MIEQGNLGLGAGWNRGIAATEGSYVLILNADAWLTEGSLERLVAFAETRPDAAVVGPRLLNPDGSLQRSVRGFPTVWRLATEYFFLRKLAPRSRVLNAFYAGGFDARRGARGRVRDGCVHARASRRDRGGRWARRVVLPLQRGDRLVLPLPPGRLEGVFFPGAECVHVGGASHGGRMFRENLRGQLRFLAKHSGPRRSRAGTPAAAPRLPSARAVALPGRAGAMYRDAARWLGSGDVPALLERRR